MRRAEHVVIAVLLAALAGLTFLYFRATRPAAVSAAEGANSGDKPASVRAATTVTAEQRGRIDPPVAPWPEPAREQPSRENAAAHPSPAAAAEQAQFDKLIDRAKSLLAEGGPDALLWAVAPSQSGDPNDTDLDRLLAEYGTETDPARLWALAQRIEFHLTGPRGGEYLIPEEQQRAFARFGSDDGDPYKRGFALNASRSADWVDPRPFLRDRVLHDPDPRIRAKAAGLLPGPKAVPESEARPVADRYLEMLESPDARIRESAAGAFGPWAFRDADVDRLIDVARDDPATGVRVAATSSLGGCAFERARRALADIAGDPAQPESVRQAAKSALDGAGIIPGK